MSTMPVATWLKFVEAEYLSTFVKDGGAAIKFPVIADDSGAEEVIAGLSKLAEDHSYVFVSVQSSTTKIHMVDALFHAVASQIDFVTLARRVIGTLAIREGYRCPASLDPAVPFEELVAKENNQDRVVVRMGLQRALTETVFRDRTLAREFRVAMLQLCMAELVGGEAGGVTRQVITEWLDGTNKAISAVRPYQIHSRVNRANARDFLGSLFAWVRRGDRAGTVIVLDLRRLTLARNPLDGSVFYTKAALLDAYEVLRQFIDGTDRLRGCFVAAIGDSGFLDIAPNSRGLGAYEALKFRVYDEVRDIDRVNPMASLVRLGAGL